MRYAVKEIVYTIQGEGANIGRPAVFCRFSGCNLWSGRHADRDHAACRFCDTDFVGIDGPGGGHFADECRLADAVAECWRQGTDEARKPFVVCTGGEPLLQLDEPAVNALHARGFEVAVETNGTLPVPRDLDWVCCSPKAATELAVRSGDELKLVFPQDGIDPSQFLTLDFRHFFLQPKDGADREVNVRRAVGYCLAHPAWRLSLQLHKVLGIP
ncbi:MAG TPA: 7-carboxy-7-deazaguanine synthase [Pirellulales bacterium]|nr:7-carboxy-7-deazaguanine synthase [Pirellulales bacterium]